MEYLQLKEAKEQKQELQLAIELILSNKAIAGKPGAAQWRFFKELANRLLFPLHQSDFDVLSSVQAAQLKFEIEDKLRRFYLRPGAPVNYVFSIIHKTKLSFYGIDDPAQYPELAKYCLMVRDLTDDHIGINFNTMENLRVYLERVVSESIDAEFRTYAALPEIKTDELYPWFCTNSPAIKEIINLVTRHQKKGWLISNPMNPSTKRLLSVKVKKIGSDEAMVNTMEYWYLRWWVTQENAYTYAYRETNRQMYILKKEADSWKVFENLRPLPRTSIPYRWKRWQKKI